MIAASRRARVRARVVSPAAGDSGAAVGGAAKARRGAPPSRGRRLLRMAAMRRPACVVFDLDGCLWSPEMYELSWMGGGPPFSPGGNNGDVMLSRRSHEVRLLGDVREVVRELHCTPEWKGTLVGISSRCDEPDWARELLRKFKIDDGRCGSFALVDAFDSELVHIYSDSKTAHFERISAQSGVPLESMIFFDNEYGNIRSVSQMGVTCIYCPQGVTTKAWQAALASFPAKSPVRP